MARPRAPLDSQARHISSVPMADLRTSTLRHAVIVALTAILMVAGVGRGLTAASDSSALTIGGIVVAICHASSGDPSGSDADRHNCCDDCVLCAAVVPPSPPTLAKPAQVVLAVWLGDPASSALTFARPWTPRQSQGPPVRVI